ncbi:XkdX family protein [Bacillus stercoris]
MIKEAMKFHDCSVDDLKEGVSAKYVTLDQFKEITGQTYEETMKAN